MKKMISLLLALLLSVPALAAEPEQVLSVASPYAFLMEKETGTVIWEKAADTRVPPASVTKVMTLLLIVEALERDELKLEDTITASARASSMGGSQIYLEEGESMSLRDMLKSIVVSSANDAAVAVAEHMCGTEAAFAARMNQRAAELGMKNTHFNNCTGLFDDPDHYTTARDVAIMSRELIRHESIKDYTQIWMDTVREGKFGLSNTNKLLRRYEGCTGLKTGYTSKAGHCLAATAERDGTEYIAVIMGAASSDERFQDAATLLNYAFANYALVQLTPPEAIAPVRVQVGEQGSFQPELRGSQKVLLPKNRVKDVEYGLETVGSVSAPITAGTEIGRLRASLDGEPIAELSLICPVDIRRRSPVALFFELAAILYGE